MIIYCKYPDPLGPDPEWTPPDERTYIHIGLPNRLDDFSVLLKDEATADCTIVVADPPDASPRTFRVHYPILAARCPQLTVGFRHESVEASTKTVELSDTSADIFRLFLELLYTGGCVVLPTQAVPMFVLCDKYMLTDYAQQCLRGLELLQHDEASSRDMLRALSAAVLPEAWAHRLLQGLTLPFSRREHQPYLPLSAPLLREVLAHSKWDWSEEDRFYLAARWVAHDPDARRRPEVLGLLWGGIHWGLVSRHGVFNCLEPEQLLTEGQLLDVVRMQADAMHLPPWMRAEQALPRVPHDRQQKWTIITDAHLTEHHRALGPVAGILSIPGLSQPLGAGATAPERSFRADVDCDWRTFVRLVGLTLGARPTRCWAFGSRHWYCEEGTEDEILQMDLVWEGADMRTWWDSSWLPGLIYVEVHPAEYYMDKDFCCSIPPLYDIAPCVTVFVKYFAAGGAGPESADPHDRLLYLGPFYLELKEPLVQLKQIWKQTDLPEWQDRCPLVRHLYHETHCEGRLCFRWGGVEALRWDTRAGDARLRDGDILIMARARLSVFAPRCFSRGRQRRARSPTWQMVKQTKVARTHEHW